MALVHLYRHFLQTETFPPGRRRVAPETQNINFPSLWKTESHNIPGGPFPKSMGAVNSSWGSSSEQGSCWVETPWPMELPTSYAESSRFAAFESPSAFQRCNCSGVIPASESNPNRNLLVHQTELRQHCDCGLSWVLYVGWVMAVLCLPSNSHTEYVCWVTSIRGMGVKRGESHGEQALTWGPAEICMHLTPGSQKTCNFPL